MAPKSTPAHPLDALWQAPTIVWALIAGESLAVILALAPGVQQDRWVYFGLASIFILWIALLSLGLLYVLRKALQRLQPQQLAYVAMAVLLVSTWIVAALMKATLGKLWEFSDDGWWPFLLRLTGMAIAVGLLGLAAFQNYWHSRQLALQAKQSQLEALQARIRPHFLFNTLNTGAALVKRQPEEVERLLLDLADLFRAALAGPREILLEDELSLARRYLEIEALRFGERLQIDWQLPREIPRVLVPSLSIQPLVENAIRHGVERLPEGGRIDISLSRTPDMVVVRIENPLPPQDRGGGGHHVGLNASQVRIEALTGGRGSVLTQREGGAFVATVRLPAA